MVANDWKIVRGNNGVGFVGLAGAVFKKDSLNYTAGGIDLPIPGFDVTAVVSVTAQDKSLSAYWTGTKLKVYEGGSEASGALTDVTITVLGH